MKLHLHRAAGSSSNTERCVRRPVRERRKGKKMSVKDRYETAHIVSEISTALLFIAGSLFLFYPQYKMAGTCLFILGSIQMFIRSMLRISYYFQFRKVIEESEFEQSSNS
ncbi:YrhK family protein [Paenibacillus sp. JX-17]|uniref:YrhK family protein n=1 Tax=Paenibacillus lacisoli TaxID=3064525 RepID=A0ABT9CAZ8_9BACL|nr:YrhK family protein [Paenibacillus sp. JX-17]MDO7906421.1 YrhK family protein [Paenibacillus sp. JX-17]